MQLNNNNNDNLFIMNNYNNWIGTIILINPFLIVDYIEWLYIAVLYIFNLYCLREVVTFGGEGVYQAKTT